jgi:hypothetical membrane protein
MAIEEATRMSTQTIHIRASLRAASGERAHDAVARWSGVLLFLVGAEFMTAIMLAASLAPNYDIAGGAISDLGVVDQTALLFNASLVFIGAANLAVGYLLYRSHRRAWILGVFTLAGLGAAGAGNFPLDTGDAHSIFALLAFVFFNVEAIACATLVSGPMRWVSTIAGAVGLAFVALMVIGDSGNPTVFGPIGHGGAERMIVYPAMIWLIAFGGYLLAVGEDR